MLSPKRFQESSGHPSEVDETPTTESQASAAELQRRHVDDAATKARIGLAPLSTVTTTLQSLYAYKDAFEDTLPETLADRLVDRPRDMVSFNPLQEWDGYVVAVNAESFRARLTDITNDGAVDEEEVEIPLSELDEDSQSQLAEGRLFRWSIGHHRLRTGQKIRVSWIILRRLPAWRREDLEAARSEARALSRKIKWE